METRLHIALWSVSNFLTKRMLNWSSIVFNTIPRMERMSWHVSYCNYGNEFVTTKSEYEGQSIAPLIISAVRLRLSKVKRKANRGFLNLSKQNYVELLRYVISTKLITAIPQSCSRFFHENNMVNHLLTSFCPIARKSSSGFTRISTCELLD